LLPHGDRQTARSRRAACLLAVVLGAIGVRSQDAGPDAWFAGLRVGMWVKVEGTRGSDGILHASRIKAYAGELDEVAVESDVAAVDLPHLTLQTSIGVRVVATPQTELEGPGQQRHVSLASLQVRDRVKVAGQLQKDGSLLAEEIELEESRRADGNAPSPDAHELTARIESLNRAGLRIVVAGLPIQLSATTRMRSSLPD
jgi:hypothetical protein